MLKNLNSTKCYFNLYLVRHGETEENKVGIIQGQSNTQLSQIGIEQARKLGQKLTDTKFTHVYSSDLDRAYQTAFEILMSNNYPTSDIVKDKLLRERKFGTAEGRLRKDLVEIAAKSGLTTTEYTPTGAETTFEVYQRAVKFFENLCKEILTNSKSNVIKFDINSNEYAALESNSQQSQTQQQQQQQHDQILNPNQLQQILNEISKNESNNNNNNNDDGVESLSSSFSSLNSLEDTSFFKNFINSCNNSSSLSSSDKINNKNDDRCSAETPSSGINGDSSEISSSPQEDLFSEILVVSHGALIREIIKYFVYDLKCEVPIDASLLKQVPLNTALSKFTVCVTSNENEFPKITCHLINDREHLAHTNLDGKTLCNM